MRVLLWIVSVLDRLLALLIIATVMPPILVIQFLAMIADKIEARIE